MKGRHVWMVACAMLSAGGCAGPTNLSGIVTMDGAPLAGATITLAPEDETAKGQLVVGMTGPDGRFVITPAAGKRIARGKYKVAISKREEQTPAQAAALIMPSETIPPKYSDQGKSELSITVPPSKDIEIKLTR